MNIAYVCMYIIDTSTYHNKEFTENIIVITVVILIEKFPGNTGDLKLISLVGRLQFS